MNFMLRAVRWARNPPSWQRVRALLAVIAFCVAVFALEHFWGWPEWLKVNGTPKLR